MVLGSYPCAPATRFDTFFVFNVDKTCKILSGRKSTLILTARKQQRSGATSCSQASGSTVVLLNHDNIYEALYDVLNQRYISKKDKASGRLRKMLRLAIGSRSQLCAVEKGFKIVVVVEQGHAYDNLDLPLLNRFEKQLLGATLPPPAALLRLA